MRDADAVAVEALAAEVRRLRRSAWAWRAAGLLALAWAAARPVGAVGPQGRAGKAVEAERFVVRDRSGKVRAVLGAWDEPLIVNGQIVQVRDGGAGLRVYSAKDADTPRVSLAANEDGTQRFMLDAGDGRNAFLGNLVDGSELSMSDATGGNRARLGLNQGGNPDLSLFDSRAASRFQVGIGPGPDQPPYMDTFDRKGDAFPLLDRAGKPLAAPAVSPTGRPSASPRR